jgi:RNA polymerase sigma-70 factor (ECF subfamily)
MLDSKTNNVDLIRMSVNGDNVAFAELVRRHDRAVFGLIARYVDNAEDAKDLYQEVFLRVHRNLRNFQLKSEFSTWVYRITVNVCLDHMKRIKRSVLSNALSIGSRDGSDHVPEPASLVPGPDDHSVNADIAARIRTAIALLPPRQRMVFVLRHYEQRSMKEMAQTLGCGEGTIKRYLFEATQSMRGALRDLLPRGGTKGATG